MSIDYSTYKEVWILQVKQENGVQFPLLITRRIFLREIFTVYFSYFRK